MTVPNWIAETYELAIEVRDFGPACPPKNRREYCLVGYGSDGQRLDYVYRRDQSETLIRKEAVDLTKRIKQEGGHSCRVRKEMQLVPLSAENITETGIRALRLRNLPRGSREREVVGLSRVFLPPRNSG